jgi:phosphatidylserine decarboxylase
VWFRPFGFKLYARIFGCNLAEMKEQDLTAYKSLGEFFYRELAPGLRPVADAPLVSPADGTVLHFGQVTDFRVEQVKGLTYSLDALLGADPPPAPPNSPAGSGTSTPTEGKPDMDVVAHQDFANVNGIEYSLGQLLGSSGSSGPATPSDTAPAARHSHAGDVSVQDTPLPEALAHDAGVAADMGVAPALARRRSWSGERGLRTGPDTALFFAVVYLAPGDYHRFHSPAAWVVERRRHFFGELFSVSPFLARRLEGLFVLNERVALLGRWRHGFFGMVPVGATNVGGIKINFDQVGSACLHMMKHMCLRVSIAPAHERARATPAAGDVHGGDVRRRERRAGRAAARAGGGDGRLLPRQHDRARVRGPARLGMGHRAWHEGQGRRGAGACARVEQQTRRNAFRLLRRPPLL